MGLSRRFAQRAAVVVLAAAGMCGLTATAAPPTAASARVVTVAAVGDMACDPADTTETKAKNLVTPRTCQHQAVSDLIVGRRPAALLALGDQQYPAGTLRAYRTRYAPTFGRLLRITHPVPGNHEYRTANAAGYFGYFGARAGVAGRGYYSFTVGSWHVIALNSNCEFVSCAVGSAQERWLRADLAAHRTRCTLAYWHHPRWSHGVEGDDSSVAPLVADLVAARVDVLLTGHDHDYERFAPRSAAGAADPKGVRQFVVGTGGRNLRPMRVGPGTEAASSDSFGALFLTLRPTSYSWQFVAVNGARFTDRGTSLCH